MSEVKKFPPSPEFSSQAHISSEAALSRFCETAELQPEAFWAELSRAIEFKKPWEQVLDWKMPLAKWFVNGKLNVSVNCVDRHAKAHPDRTAILWEAEPLGEAQRPLQRKLSYKELLELVCQISNALKNAGVGKGDRVAIYMPMLPETVATMLACARIGAIHTVVFGGFSSSAIYDRCVDSGAKLIVTADGAYRRGSFLKLKAIVDEALQKAGHGVKSCLVFERDATQVTNYVSGRDLKWKDAVLLQSKTCEPEILDSEDPLFILYTSGTTGKPKGLFHTQVGYLLWAHWSTRWLFDLKAEKDLFWCTADCGWITGHTYVTYGPLSNGASIFIYEGAPTTPTAYRFWEMIDRNKISILYTAPTAIRSFMRLGDEHPNAFKMSSLRVLGSVGEPINPEAWLWYYDKVGKNRCPIVDTWWQTETGGAMIAPFPGASVLKPGSATKALPGIEAAVVNAETGTEVKSGEKGVLVIRKPWPSMARGIWGDPARFEKTYWNTRPELKGIYVTADFAEVDADGDIWVEGRMDDVIKVSGHRIGSAEVESALVSHHWISEAAAVGIPDAVKGEAIVAFITLKDEVSKKIESGALSLDEVKIQARDQVTKEIGSFAKPDKIRTAKALPKTRSGKIMRRLLRELAQTGKMSGDTTTLEDFSPQNAIEHED